MWRVVSGMSRRMNVVMREGEVMKYNNNLLL